MQFISRPKLACSLCGGAVGTVEQRKDPLNLGATVLTDIALSFGLILCIAAGTWAWAAGLLLFVFFGLVYLLIRNPRSATYRCESCKSVLTYAEVSRKTRHEA